MIGSQSTLAASSGDQSQFPTSFPPEEEEAGGGFTLVQVWYMLLANVWLSIGIFLVMLGLAFMGIKWLPKSYEATAALIVNSDNTDPLAGRNLPIGQTGTFFPTQVELINNPVVLRPVIDRLKLQTDRRFTKGFVGDPKALDDVVLANLRGALQVQQGGGSQLLYISAMALDAVQAADIANAVAEEYLRQTSQRTNAPAIERAKRYSDQVAELRSKVDTTQAKVAEFRERHGMADLKDGQNGDSEGAALADLQTKLLQARNERRQLESKQVDANADSSAVLETPQAVGLQDTLNKLQGQLGQATATLGRQHPRVLQLQSEIDSTRKALQSAVRARSDNSAMLLARARELEAKYEAAMAAEQNRLLERRGEQDEGAKLLLEQRLAEETYARALRGLDEVQFASVGNYKDVTLVSRAEPSVKAAKPNKLKLLAMAMMASMGVAVGGPFAFELLLNRRIRCRDDLERHFRIQMLAQFGRMSPAPAA